MDPVTVIVKETLGVIHLLGRPVCRLVYKCSISERLNTTEKTLDKAFNEIHQKDVLPNVEPKVIAGILAMLTAIRRDIADVRNFENFPQSLNINHLKDARRVEIAANSLYRFTKQTSRNVRWRSLPQNAREATEKEAERRAREDERYDGKEKRRLPEDKRRAPKADKDKQRAIRVQDSERKPLVTKQDVHDDAEACAAHMQLQKACSEIPGLDPEKVLDIIIMILQDKVNGRPCNIKNFKKTVSKCIDLEGQSKDAAGTPKILPSGAAEDALARIIKGLADLASSTRVNGGVDLSGRREVLI